MKNIFTLTKTFYRCFMVYDIKHHPHFVDEKIETQR